MILNSFIERTKYVSYDYGGEIYSCIATDNPNGLFEFIDNTFVAFYCVDNDAFVQVGDSRFSIKDADNVLDFNGESEQCKFYIKKGGQMLFEFMYAPWWKRRKPNFIVAFGQPDDEGEDLLAYVSMMCGQSDTKNHLISVFSGNYLGVS